MSRFYSDANQDSDGDGRLDGAEDEDHDLLPNLRRDFTLQDRKRPTSTGCKTDTDGDGLCDGLDDQDHDGPPTSLCSGRLHDAGAEQRTRAAPRRPTRQLGPGGDPDPQGSTATTTRTATSTSGTSRAQIRRSARLRPLRPGARTRSARTARRTTSTRSRSPARKKFFSRGG